LAVLAITAAAVVLAMAMTALATTELPADRQVRTVTIAAVVTSVIGVVFFYWFVDSIRAMGKKNDAANRLAGTDDLTGLHNRRAFLASAERELARAERQSGELALLIVDLDHFKRVNDTHGHSVGDSALVAVANVLALSVRVDVDIVGRLGGEEFAVLLPGCDAPTALQAAERIRVAIEALRVAAPGGEVAMTASIGCAAIAGGGLAAVQQAADDALYAAKRGGRNQVVAAGAWQDRPELREPAKRLAREPEEREPLKRSA